MTFGSLVLLEVSVSVSTKASEVVHFARPASLPILVRAITTSKRLRKKSFSRSGNPIRGNNRA
jgi:hypothetical protein